MRNFGAAPQNQGQAGPLPAPTRPAIQFVEDFFIYDLDILLLAPGATANANITIQADSDFKLVKIGQMTDIAGTDPAEAVAGLATRATFIIPMVTLQLVDTGSGRQLFSSPVAMGAIFGSGELPFILSVPRIFKARTNISLSFTNYDVANTYNIRTAFIGNKIFQQGG